MNYLAHLYLSGNNSDIRFGNFIGDTVLGKEYNIYSKEIQEGVLLHRKIDVYTDKHPIFREHTKLLFPQFSHYSRVIVDIFYDHFLASLWDDYHAQSLERYTEEFYDSIENYSTLFPLKMKRIYPYMKSQNWFLKYKTLDGLTQILAQMENRTRFKYNLKESVTNLEEDYQTFKKGFLIFFAEIQFFVSSKQNNGI